MTSATAETIAKMVEQLPRGLQDRVLVYLREYIEDIREEMK